MDTAAPDPTDIPQLTASPDVWRKAAELEAAIAQVAAAKLSRVPHVTTSVGYTRLSKIDATEIARGVTLSQINNRYAAEAQLSIPLSDHLLRFPKLVDAAHAGERAARADKRVAEQIPPLRRRRSRRSSSTRRTCHHRHRNHHARAVHA